jgi:predicted permease
MTTVLADLRYALRAARRAPLFAVVAVLSLALGIGANTAIFTILDQLMLRSLPVADPGSLVMLHQQGFHSGSNSGPRMHSYPLYRDFQQRGEPLAEVACRRLASASVSIGNRTERAQVEAVSGNYFTMLGVKPAAGRVFSSEEDDRVYQGHPVVVLSHDYWRTRFASDRAAVGSKILVNNYPMTIVGVAAEGFHGLDPVESPHMWAPILMKPSVFPEMGWVDMENRRSRWVQVFARLKPGHTEETARAALQPLFIQIRQHELTLPGARFFTPYTRERFLQGTIQVERAAAGYSRARNSFSSALVVLMSMVALVLLIACANVANLLIARAFARQKEIAVRLSMGATRGRLMRQLLVESMTLAVAGGVVGVGLAVALTRALIAMVPAEGSPLLIRAEPDLRILGFTFALTLATGVVFGLVPALRASRPDLWTTLKDEAGSIAGTGSLFLRKGLVAAQVALSFLLLFGAGLFVRSLQNLRGADTGFRELDNLVQFRVSPSLSGYDGARGTQFYSSLIESIRAVPGVKAAGAARVSLLSGDEWDNTMSVEGHTAKEGEDMQAYMNSISPGYFQAMGVPLLEGRDFDRRDVRPNNKVAIVNRRFARHFFGERTAVGRFIGNGGGPNTKLDIEIVGVAQDTLYEGPREGVRRQVFIPNLGNGSSTIYVRVAMESTAAHAAIRRSVAALDAGMPVYGMKTLAAQLDQQLLTERLVGALSAGFGMLATVLAAIGLYGVMAFVVGRRTREMGVRLALGARPGAVVWLVMREVVALVAIGLAVGLPSALALGRLVSTQLFGVQPSDPAVAVASMALLVVVSGVAGLIPANRAGRIDPILALRYE